MFLLVQAYDVLDQIFLRVHMVDDDQAEGAMTTIFKANVEQHRPRDIRSERDVIAFVGEQLVDIAHQESPLL